MMKITILFSRLLYSSFTASILIGIIFLTKFIFKQKLGAKWHYYIWILLIIRLLIPYAPESSFNILNIINNIVMENKDLSNQEVISQNSTKISQRIEETDLPHDYALSVKRKFLYANWKILFWIWLIGVIIFSSHVIIVNSKQYYKLKSNDIILKEDIIQVLEKCKKIMKIDSKIVLLQSNEIKSPLLLGFIHPYLLIPVKNIENLTLNQLKYVIFHELVHYKHKDILVNWIISFAQILHWFNPLVWLAFYQMKQDREIACDAGVLSYIEDEEYSCYGETIIALLKNYNNHHSLVFMTGFLNNKRQLKKRITRISLFKEVSKFKIILGMIMSILMVFIFLTNTKGVADTINIEKILFDKEVVYEDLSKYFHGYQGSFVLFDMNKTRYYIYNEKKSKERISPCSTFKIINSLIGLESGLLEDENTIIKWDGTHYSITEWNKDHTLASSIFYSVSWYFQKLDLKLGHDNIKRYINKVDYGNNDISGGIEDFWLESSLKIAPIEQVQFLERFYNYKVPFSRRNIDIVKKIIKVKEDQGVVLSGKTGSGIVNNKSINGWFIGYLEKKDEVYFFATNIQSSKKASGSKARDITISILKDKKILNI